MNFNELVEELSNKTGLSKYRIKKVYKELRVIIEEGLEDGDVISLVGIGKLSTVDTKGRIGINPKTLESVDIPANKRVKFKVSSTLRNKIRI